MQKQQFCFQKTCLRTVYNIMHQIHIPLGWFRSVTNCCNANIACNSNCSLLFMYLRKIFMRFCSNSLSHLIIEFGSKINIISSKKEDIDKERSHFYSLSSISEMIDNWTFAKWNNCLWYFGFNPLLGIFF